MATLPPRTSTLCDYCQQKPKFNGHTYCSKTCGSLAQAQSNTVANSNMCHYCGLKPKFANYNYCGKNCANAAQGQGQTKGNSKYPQTTTATKAQTFPSNNTGQGYNNHVKQQRVTNPPVQQVQQPQTQGQPQKLLGLFPMPSSKIRTTGTNQGGLTLSTNPPLQVAAGPVLCMIKGCKEYVHIDANGYQTSEYCSMRHRLEAVESGIVSPCIMCLTMPQSMEDHFCGRQCRDEALSK